MVVANMGTILGAELVNVCPALGGNGYIVKSNDKFYICRKNTVNKRSITIRCRYYRALPGRERCRFTAVLRCLNCFDREDPRFDSFDNLVLVKANSFHTCEEGSEFSDCRDLPGTRPCFTSKLGSDSGHEISSPLTFTDEMFPL